MYGATAEWSHDYDVGGGSGELEACKHSVGTRTAGVPHACILRVSWIWYLSVECVGTFDRSSHPFPFPSLHPLSPPSPQPKEIKDIRDFLQKARRYVQLVGSS